jgi:hypothetical protein
LIETTFTLVPAIVPGSQGEFGDRIHWPVPGHARITDLVSAYPVLTGVERLRIEIEPLTPDVRFWAFVSTTNNETQHVTVTLPD